MDLPDEMNEKLREVCCTGKTDAVLSLLDNGADVNSQNKVNGWTCLHWAAKRGHTSLIPILLERGANVDVENFKRERASDLAYNNDIRNMLEKSDCNRISYNTDDKHSFQPIAAGKSHFVPNYLKHPLFPYTYKEPTLVGKINTFSSHYNGSSTVNSELVLKVRNGSSQEKDFIEIELDKSNLTFQHLMDVCCNELQINVSMVTKVRKLPNTIIRKDKDVRRLVDFQEIELLSQEDCILQI